jgi:hypothetical protein
VPAGQPAVSARLRSDRGGDDDGDAERGPGGIKLDARGCDAAHRGGRRASRHVLVVGAVLAMLLLGIVGLAGANVAVKAVAAIR